MFMINDSPNQEHSDLNWETEVWSFLFCLLNYALYT